MVGMHGSRPPCLGLEPIVYAGGIKPDAPNWHTYAKIEVILVPWAVQMFTLPLVELGLGLVNTFVYENHMGSPGSHMGSRENFCVRVCVWRCVCVRGTESEWVFMGVKMSCGVHTWNAYCTTRI